MPAKYLQESVRGHAAFASVETDIFKQIMDALYYQLLPASDREEGPQTKKRKGSAGKGFGQPDYGGIAGVVATVGNGIGTGPGQFKTDVSMNQVSFGSDGTLWAVDWCGHRVHQFKQSGELIKTIGPGQLRSPVGVAVSRLGSSVFIGEITDIGRIHEFNQSDGAFVRVLDTPGLRELYGMCLSPDETILAVACFRSHCIKVIRVDGSEAPRTIGGQQGSGDGLVMGPTDVRFTPDGQQLVVADSSNCVKVVGLDGSFVRQIPLGAEPYAVAVDAAGNIIATTRKHVKVFSPEGTLLHDRLGGVEIADAAESSLAIDPSSGRVAAGDRDVGKIHLL